MQPGGVWAAAAVALLLMFCPPPWAGAADDSPPSAAYYWGETFPDVDAWSYDPSPVPGAFPLRPDTVTVGNKFACGLFENGSAWCMGNNQKGQLGVGADAPNASVPMPVAGGKACSVVSASAWAPIACCLLAVEKTVQCWGQSGAEAPNATFSDPPRLINSPVPAPAAPGFKFSSISVGLMHVCGIEEGTARIVCWGTTGYGALGRGGARNQTAEELIGKPGANTGFTGLSFDGVDVLLGPDYIDLPPTLRFVEVRASNYYTFARAESGEWYCWGANDYGQCSTLSSTTLTMLSTPVPVPNSSGYTQLRVGGNHGCAIRDERLFCWGMNSNAQLGCGPGCGNLTITQDQPDGGNAPFSPIPLEVAGGHRWRQAMPSIYYSCGVTTNGTALCWGMGYLKESTLGRGMFTAPPKGPDGIRLKANTTLEDTTVPYPVAGSHNFSSLTSGVGTVIGFLADQPVNTSAGAAAAPVSSDSSSAPVGAIVGGVVGGLALVAVAAALAVAWRRRQRSSEELPVATAAASNGAVAALPSDYVAGLSGSYYLLPNGSQGGELGFTPSHHSLESDQLISYINSTLASSGPRQRHTSSGSFVLGSSGSSGELPAEVQQWEVQWEDIQLERLVGRGSFGRVYLGHWQSVPVAIKVLLGAEDLVPASLELPGPIMQQLLGEACVLSKLRHPNVLSFLGICCLPPCLLTEYCAGGSLYDLLSAATRDAELAAALTWHRRLAMLLDAAAGLNYLHTRSPPIIHRDVKSPNLLIDEHWSLKVSDFNLSKILSSQPIASSTGGANNPTWLAPELLEGEAATAACDTYALGLVMWEVLTWRLPWSHAGDPGGEPPSVFKIASLVRHGERPPVPHPSALPGPRDLDAEGLDAYCRLMSECWAQQPEDRPSLDNIMDRLRAMLASMEWQ